MSLLLFKRLLIAVLAALAEALLDIQACIGSRKGNILFVEIVKGIRDDLRLLACQIGLFLSLVRSCERSATLGSTRHPCWHGIRQRLHLLHLNVLLPDLLAQ